MSNTISSSYQTTNSPSHHLSAGVVSFSLIWDLLAEYEDFVRRLTYIIDTVPDKHYNESHEFLESLICDAEKEIEPYFDRAKNERAILGGHNVYVGKAPTEEEVSYSNDSIDNCIGALEAVLEASRKEATS